ncbi:hypothetical protein SDC9_171417 [bioreactor metagenome]|uniref:Uncharacterized protein n=1 Tax=bioreactor metagenome TaxID=1076179 RepID=A0A645GJE0_9ZZZZ
MQCLLNALSFPHQSLIALAGDQARAQGFMRQPVVRIILPEQQAIFASGGHHAVGLRRAFNRKIIHQYTQIRLVPPKRQRFLAAAIERGVNARQ